MKFPMYVLMTAFVIGAFLYVCNTPEPSHSWRLDYVTPDRLSSVYKKGDSVKIVHVIDGKEISHIVKIGE